MSWICVVVFLRHRLGDKPLKRGGHCHEMGLFSVGLCLWAVVGRSPGVERLVVTGAGETILTAAWL